ncbi:MAG: hypothetical protein M1834_005327 [Cirrosporium novae-zelandiae]|nr:MAG: hypothetical protein M1834_005327 [Cirrosporium novae-zelandiae]
METVGLVASIVQLIDTTSKVINYIDDVKGAHKEQVALAREAKNTVALLKKLKDKAEEQEKAERKESDSWWTTVQDLGVEDGPFDQLKEGMKMAEKFKSESGSKQFYRSVFWPHTKKQFKRLLDQTERVKSLISLALTDKLMFQSSRLVEQTKSIKEDTVFLKQSVSTSEMQQQIQLDDKQTITDWISPIDYAIQYTDFIKVRQEETGLWLIESPEFQTWLKTPKTTLFCPGIPGAGKTMMATTVIEYLWNTFAVEETENIGVSFLYCNFKRQNEQTIDDLVAALIKQLIQEQPLVPGCVKNLYDTHHDRKTRPSLSELLKTLGLVIDTYPTVFIIVDALDECSIIDRIRVDFLDNILKLQLHGDIRLLLTSRFVPDITEKLETKPTLEVKASDADVRKYVRAYLPKLGKCVLNSVDLQEKIISTIIEAVEGMHLYIDSLRGKATARNIKTALSQFQKNGRNLEIAYKDALERIDNQPQDHRELARKAISWIVCAKRRLTIQELQEALAVEPEDTDLDKDNYPDMDEIRSWCVGLVTVDEESNIVRLVHYTAQEYFDRKLDEWIPTGKMYIARTCLTYLSFETFASGHCSTDEKFKSRADSHSLLDYTSNFWGEHMITNSEAEVENLALKFLQDESLTQSAAQAMFIDIGEYSRYFRAKGTGLHFAAHFGLDKLLLSLIRKNQFLDVRDQNDNTPLTWAVIQGQEATVKLLVDQKNVDADNKNKNGWTPLIFAAENSDENIVKFLAERDDVDTDNKDKNGWTPLIYAANRGHENIVKFLAERDDVDTDNKDKYGQTPLMFAADKGHENIVQYLTEHEVDVNLKDDDGQTALMCAAEHGYTDIVQFLAEHKDVDVDSKDIRGWTALIYAARSGYINTVQFLAEHEDVDVHSKDDNGWTASMHAEYLAEHPAKHLANPFTKHASENITKDNFEKIAEYLREVEDTPDDSD